MIKDMETSLKTEKKVMQEDTRYVYTYILASEAGVKLLYKLRKSIKGNLFVSKGCFIPLLLRTKAGLPSYTCIRFLSSSRENMFTRRVILLKS